MRLKGDAEKYWAEEVEHALSCGDLEWDDDDKRWGSNTPEKLHRHGYYNTEGKKWGVLPPELWHATTALTAVMKEGLKTREELGQQQGKGLGGGTDEAISLTDSKATAERIAESILELRGVLRGDVSVGQLWEDAKSGARSQRPWAEELARYISGNGTHDLATDGVPRRLQQMLDGERELRTSGYLTDENTAQLNSHGIDTGGYLFMLPEGDKLPDGWRAVDPQKRPDGRTVTVGIIRPATPDELMSDRAEFFKAWSAFRESYGKGPEDPLFFMSDYAAIRDLDPTEVGVVSVRPKNPGKTMGWHLNALSEWRVKGGQYVDVGRLEAAASDLWAGARWNILGELRLKRERAKAAASR